MTWLALALLSSLCSAEPGLPPLSAAPVDPLSAGAYYLQLGNAFASWDQWDSAFNCYRASVSRDPRNGRSQVRMARSLFRIGRPAEAALAARLGLKAMPFDPEALRVFAGVSLGVGENDLAESSLRSLIRTNPRDADSLRLLGALLRQTNRLPEADSMLRAAVAVKPQDVDAWLELAKCAQERGDEGQAATFLRQAVDVQPGNIPALSALIGLLNKQNKQAEALGLALMALEREPSNPDLLLGCGDLLAQAQRYEEAASLFRRAYFLNLPQATVQASLFLSQYAMGRGQYADAARYARRGLAIKADLVPLRTTLVSALVAQLDFAGAADALAPLVTAQPKNPGVTLQWIDFLVRARRFDTAERAARGIIDRFNGHPGITGAAITALVGGGRGQQATALMAGAVRRYPREPQLGYLYYSCLRHTGHRAEGLAYLAELRRRFPEDPMPQREMGMDRYERADWAGARTLLGPLFERGRIDPQAIAALAWSCQNTGDYGTAAKAFGVLSSQEPRALFDVARQFVLANRDAQAIAIYDKLLKAGQSRYAALLGKARAVANSGGWAQCLDLFDQVLADNPRDLLALRGKVKAFILLRQPDKARAAAAACMKALPGESVGHLLAADIEAKNGDWQKAIDAYVKGVTAIPRSSLLHERLGDAYLRADANPSLAAAQYELATQMDPRAWYARWRQADLAEARDQFATAALLWRQALDCAPETSWPYRHWLSALAAAEGQSAALKAGTQWLAAASPRTASAEPLVQYAAERGLLDELRAGLQPSLGVAAAQTLRDAYGLALLRRGDGPAAVDYYRQQADRDRLNPLWLRRLGEGWELRGEQAKALECYRSAAHLGGADLENLALLANIEAATGKVTEAIGRLTETLRQAPDNAAAVEVLLRSFAEQKLLARVIPAFVALMDGDAKHGKKQLVPAAGMAPMRAALGLAYELNGDRSEALGRYQQALAIDPLDLTAQRGLQRLTGHGPRAYRWPSVGEVATAR